MSDEQGQTGPVIIDFKLWNAIQKLRTYANEHPEEIVKEQLHEMKREYYNRTGGRGE